MQWVFSSPSYKHRARTWKMKALAWCETTGKCWSHTSWPGVTEHSTWLLVPTPHLHTVMLLKRPAPELVGNIQRHRVLHVKDCFRPSHQQVLWWSREEKFESGCQSRWGATALRTTYILLQRQHMAATPRREWGSKGRLAWARLTTCPTAGKARF